MLKNKNTITIHEHLPSLNVLANLHWWKRRELYRFWYVSLRFAKPAIEWGIPEKRKYFVTITRFSPKLLDYDNFVGACKIILDGLKAVKRKRIGKKMLTFIDTGLIYDDSPALLKVIYKQKKSKEYKVIITIT